MITFPTDARARLHRFVVGDDKAWVVIAARLPVEAVPASLYRPGDVAALLTHDDGIDWPNAAGEALASATLESGGAVGFAFPRVRNALACLRRLQGGAA
jgi:hypothetical protein